MLNLMANAMLSFKAFFIIMISVSVICRHNKIQGLTNLFQTLSGMHHNQLFVGEVGA